jgi:hypothetical protein
MSVKSKLFASAAALTMVSGVGLAGALTAGTASAETPSAGSSAVDFFNFGTGSTYQSPSYLLDSYKQAQGTGNPLILFATNNTDPAEDFTAQTPEPVSDFFQAGLVTANLALHYGCLPGVNFAECTGTGGIGVNDYAFEIQYAPFGAPTGQCVGVAATATAGEKVTLQPCGQSGKTLWIFDTPCFSSVTEPNGSTSGAPGDLCTAHRGGYPLAQWKSFIENTHFPLLNGSDTTFSDPDALSYPNGASPTSLPRVGLQLSALTTFSNSNGFPNGNINDNQLWGARFGEAQP